MEYKKIRLKDVVISANTGADAIQRAPIVDFDTGKRCLRIGDISNHREYENWGFTNVNDENYKKYKLEKNDILIARTGSTIGINKFIDRDLEAVYNNGLIRLRVNKEKYNSKYIYYNLQTSEFRNFIDSIAFGTTGQPNMKINDLLTFKIEDISIEKQNKLVNIVDKLDKKIELNNQINNNLQELSLVLYKKWFNQLDEGNITTLSQFDKFGKVVMGQSPKGESYNYNKNGIPLINGAADYENGTLKAQKYTTMPTKICDKGDLIFCIRATIGLLTICDKKYCLGRGVAGITNIDEVYKEYIYHLMNSYIESFKSLATGSVIVGISRDDIQDIKVRVPSLEQIQKFHKVQKPIFKKSEWIIQENKTLNQLRCTLLPKLMKGEINLDKIEI